MLRHEPENITLTAFRFEPVVAGVSTILEVSSFSTASFHDFIASPAFCKSKNRI
jgi:hypothetical protein